MSQKAARYPGGTLKLTHGVAPTINDTQWHIIEEHDNFLETILDRVKSGKSFSVFGAPGVGKSFVLKKIKEVLLQSKQKCEAIAPTHAASRLIGGTTVHYFLGKYSNYAFEGWVLLDEISMLTLPLIAALSQMAAKMKIICFGDFDQLNPCYNSWRGKQIEGNFFEHSQLLKTWSENTIFKVDKMPSK